MKNNTQNKEFIDRIKKGNKIAFKKLHEEFAPRIYQFSLTFLKNENQSEELVQDVFVKIWENRNKLDAGKNLQSYIYKIAVNQIYQLIRKRNIENAYLDYLKNNFRIDENLTWNKVVLDDMLENLEIVIQKLPEQQRKIFHLSRDKGLSNDEIARKLNLSKRTVENHLYRAIHYLKEHFKTDSFLATLLLYYYLGC